MTTQRSKVWLSGAEVLQDLAIETQRLRDAGAGLGQDRSPASRGLPGCCSTRP